MSEFRRVGPEVAYGDVRVGLDDVRPIHDFVVGDLLDASPKANVRWHEKHDKLSLSFYFSPQSEFDENQENRHITAILHHFEKPDCWRLILGVRKYTAERRDSNRLSLYRFEVVNGQVIEAKKEAFFIDGEREILVDEAGDMIEVSRTDRKMYERRLEDMDCGNLIGILQRTTKRAKVK